MKILEQWASFHGYKISNCGRVVSPTGREMKQRSQPKGYRMVTINPDGQRHGLGIAVHRLVALTFIDNPMPLFWTQVNHIDGNPANNHADNLEWCDCAYNNRDKIARRRAAGLPLAPPHMCRRVMYQGAIYDSINEMARVFNVERKRIRERLKAGTWRGEPIVSQGSPLGSGPLNPKTKPPAPTARF